MKVLWSLQTKCNLNCKYCYFNINNRRTEHLDPMYNYFKDETKLKELIKKISEYGDTFYLSGGEPLLLGMNLVKISKLLKEENKRVILTTNGTLFNKRIFDELSKYLDGVIISLDSYKKEYHNKYRGLWELTVKTIKKLKENYEVPMGICTVITKENLKDLENTMNFLGDLNVDYFKFQPIYLPKEHPLYKELSLNENDYKYILNNIENLKKIANQNNIVVPWIGIKKMFSYLLEKPKIIKDCEIAKNLVFITENLKVAPCAAYKYISNEKWLVNIGEKKKYPKECKFFSEDCACLFNIIYSPLF